MILEGPEEECEAHPCTPTAGRYVYRWTPGGAPAPVPGPSDLSSVECCSVLLFMQNSC